METRIVLLLHVGKEAEPMMIGHVSPSDFEPLMRIYSKAGLVMWGAHYTYDGFSLTMEDGGGMPIADVKFYQTKD
jgi:hypothetical protein